MENLSQREQIIQSEAVWSFGAFLTTVSDDVLLGAKHESSRVIPLIEEFLKRRENGERPYSELPKNGPESAYNVLRQGILSDTQFALMWKGNVEVALRKFVSENQLEDASSAVMHMLFDTPQGVKV